MGMLERIRDPRAVGVAPSRFAVAPPRAVLLSDEPGGRPGVSSTSLRNCELFMIVGVHMLWRNRM